MTQTDDMAEGEREFVLDDGRVLVFSPHSRIEIYAGKEAEEVLASFDPATLSIIYGAYRQMQKEMNEAGGIDK